MMNAAIEDRYRILFANNIAGVCLSTPAGELVDCNDALVETFGFEQRAEFLTHSAWDFYLERQDRDAVIQPDNVMENHLAQELAFRHRTGRPIWLRYTRTVVSRSNGRPELMLVTATDVTELRELREQLRDFSKEMRTWPAVGTNPLAGSPTQELASLLQTVNQTLRPENLESLCKPDLRQFIQSVERMKVLMEELAMNQATFRSRD